MNSLFNRAEFGQALRSRNVAEILRHLKVGNTVNTDVGVRVFDVLLSLSSPEAEKGLKVLLRNPHWNPNYRSVDTWHPEERAMIYHREDLALQVIKHPNFDKAEYPRVIRSANLLKANKVLSFLNQRTRA